MDIEACKRDLNNETEEPFQKVTYKKKNHVPATNRKGKPKKSIAIIGDSIIKEIRDHLPTFDHAKVTVNSYPGATTAQLYKYTESLDFKPDAVMVHVGTNDLTMTENDDEVADNIINFVKHLNGKYGIPVIIALLTYRIDFKHKHSRRIKGVNEALRARCGDLDVGYIENNNIRKYHLGTGGVLLNKEGSAILAENFRRVINVLNFNKRGKQQTRIKKKGPGR